MFFQPGGGTTGAWGRLTWGRDGARRPERAVRVMGADSDLRAGAGRRWRALSNLFFSSSQTDVWLPRYGHFKFWGDVVRQN